MNQCHAGLISLKGRAARQPATTIGLMDLFTVTTLSPRGPMYGGTRLVAVCTTVERAHDIIRGNEGDIYETSYQYAVIETVESDSLYGLTGQLRDAIFYEWFGDYHSGSYKPIQTPKEFLHTLGFWEAGPIRNSIIDLKAVINDPSNDRRIAKAFDLLDQIDNTSKRKRKP